LQLVETLDMRISIAAALLAATFAGPSLAKNKGRTARVARAAPVETVSCPRGAPEPTGLCAPYDRDHCRFEDGSLLRDDPRDPRSPFVLRPVAGKVALYCRYDSALRFAGVDKVEDPATQKKKWDASKPRRKKRVAKVEEVEEEESGD
jgi:hypothetical protein